MPVPTRANATIVHGESLRQEKKEAPLQRGSDRFKPMIPHVDFPFPHPPFFFVLSSLTPLPYTPLTPLPATRIVVFRSRGSRTHYHTECVLYQRHDTLRRSSAETPT